jgi:hypothetical protein
MKARGLAMAFALSAAGCSALGSVPPPKQPIFAFEQCSTSRFAPVADIYGAVNTGALAVFFLAGTAVEYEHNQNATVPSWDPKPLKVDSVWLVGSVLSTAATIAFIASAQYGLKSARDCQAAREELMRRLPPGQWPPGATFNGMTFGPDGRPVPEAPSGPWPSR